MVQPTSTSGSRSEDPSRKITSATGDGLIGPRLPLLNSSHTDAGEDLAAQSDPLHALDSLIALVRECSKDGEIERTANMIAVSLVFASREGVPVTRALITHVTLMMAMAIENCPEPEPNPDMKGKVYPIPERDSVDMASSVIDHLIDRIGVTLVRDELFDGE